MTDQDRSQYLRIGLASPEQIRSWAERTLPNGEVVGRINQPTTVNYKTHRPERDGLFCERVFGPTRRGICACGKRQVNSTELTSSRFCEECGVEFVESRVRRHRMGYIQLACPVTHPWYLRHRPSYIAYITDIPRKYLESLVYCDLFLIRPETKRPGLLWPRALFRWNEEVWGKVLPHFLSFMGFEMFQERELSTGGTAVERELEKLQLDSILSCAQTEWNTLCIAEVASTNIWAYKKIQIRKNKLIKRVRLAKQLSRAHIHPEWMVLSVLPVLPPELRPMIELEEGLWITSDLNELYRRVIYRNNHLIYLLSMHSPASISVVSQKRLVQQAIDALLANGMGAPPMRDSHKRAYKSFSDVIKGKEGRFRENLLGKRVDYSGRSVIVVGPSLNLSQCGLPIEMAIELFQPFVVRSLLARNLAPNLRAAKSLIQDKHPVVWDVLTQVVEGRLVLLNRAPTLHRLGVQAFKPVLVRNRAIHLHPLVCTGFNADFDGDQMAVHVPLSCEAQAEARVLMMSHTSLLSSATGAATTVPTQDMLLGIYALTLGSQQGLYDSRKKFAAYRAPSTTPKPSYIFSNYDDIMVLYSLKQIQADSQIWLKWNKKKQVLGMDRNEVPIEIQYEYSGNSLHVYQNWHVRVDKMSLPLGTYLSTTVGRVILDQKVEEAIQAFAFY